MKSNRNATLVLPLRTESDQCCPYAGASDLCAASLYSFFPSATVWLNFCNTEDYDNCPIFLAKTLREGGGDDLCRI